jgi:hypothetical protein
MAHKVMPPAFTSEQLEMIEGMIGAAIAELNWDRDIENAVESAVSDVRHNVDMLENSVNDLERRIDDGD